MPKESVASLCDRIREIKRRKDAVIKGRIRIENSLASNAATIMGYHSGMTAKDRKEHWCKQKVLVMSLLSAYKKSKGDVEKSIPDVEGDRLAIITILVMNVAPSIIGLDAQKTAYEKRITQIVRKLPVWKWVNGDDVRGVGEIMLGNVIGETGDLANYDNPAKVWKRMGCAPYEKKGETHTGAGWKSKGTKSLTKSEWEEFGYNPKRRSVVFNLAVNIQMQCSGLNAKRKGADNAYSRRHAEAKKLAAKKHPDWSNGHCENHALLLCGKRFLRDLWVIWNGYEIAS